MPRVRLAALGLVLLSPGCTRDNPAFGIGLLGGSATDSASDAGSDSGGDTTAITATSGGGTSSATGTASMGSGSATTGATATATSSSTGPSTTSASASSSTSTGPLTTAAASPTATDSDSDSTSDTGEPPTCGGFPAGFAPFVALTGPEGELDPCTSGTVVIEGPVVGITETGLVVEDCRARPNPCEPCGGAPYFVDTYVASDEHLPSVAVDCAEVVVRYERTAWGECITGAAAMFARNANNIDQLVDPFWLMLQFGLDPLIALPGDLRIEKYLIGETACACEQPGCCSDVPGFYELKLSGFEGGSVVVTEGQEVFGFRGGLEWLVTAYASHHDGLCGFPLHLELVAKSYPRP